MFARIVRRLFTNLTAIWKECFGTETPSLCHEMGVVGWVGGGRKTDINKNTFPCHREASTVHGIKTPELHLFNRMSKKSDYYLIPRGSKVRSSAWWLVILIEDFKMCSSATPNKGTYCKIVSGNLLPCSSLPMFILVFDIY